MRRFLLVVLGLFGLTGFGQHQKAVDFLSVQVRLVPDTINQSLKAEARYHFRILQDTREIFLDARSMDFHSIELESQKLSHRYVDNKLYLSSNYQKDTTYTLNLEYTVTPKQAVYFLGWSAQAENSQIWTQGQGKYTSSWLPSLDDMRDKLIFDVELCFWPGYTVLSNGRFEGVSAEGGNACWRYRMQRPMSSYLLAFVIGKFDKKVHHSKSGTVLEYYMYPDSSNTVSTTYRYGPEVFELLESKINVPYPWEVYRQVPLREFLYAGMENTSLTTFSDQYLVDSIGLADYDYLNIHAHELAHQWFGNLVTEASGEHHWLHEGFATFYAYLVEKELRGEAYFYWHLYQTAQILISQDQKGQGESLLDPGASSLTFYEKGAWALFVLQQQLGSKNFDRAISRYLNTYAFGSVEVSDFLKEAAASSGMSMQSFENQWLKSKDFATEVALNMLSSKFLEVKRYLEVLSLFERDKTAGKLALNKLLESNLSNIGKSIIVEQHYPLIEEEHLRKLYATEDPEIKKALLRGQKNIRPWMKSTLEAWLKGTSYEVREQSLVWLWQGFPEDRSRILKDFEVASKQSPGTRMSWILLNLLSEVQQEEVLKSATLISEMRSFTGAKHSLETRAKAYSLLKQFRLWSDENLKELVADADHYSWQFRNQARSILDALMNDAVYLERITELNNLSLYKKSSYLNRKLKEQ